MDNGQAQLSREFTLLNRVERALGEAGSIEQIKRIRDQAQAIRTNARSANLGLEIENYAAEVTLRAERKAGRLLSPRRL